MHISIGLIQNLHDCNPKFFTRNILIISISQIYYTVYIYLDDNIWVSKLKGFKYLKIMQLILGFFIT